MDYFEIERTILKRLVEVDLSSVPLDAEIVERSLSDYFAFLGLRRRPVRWVKDAREGATAVRYEEHDAVLGGLKLALERAALKAMGQSLRDEAGAALRLRPQPNKRLQLEFNKQRNWQLFLLVKRAVSRRAIARYVTWPGYERVLSGHTAHDVRWMWGETWEAAQDLLYTSAQAMNSMAVSKLAGKRRRLEIPAEVGEIFLRLISAHEAGLWLYWLTTDEIVCVPRPVIMVEDGRLHSTKGPAVFWPDGERYYFLHGVEVQADMIESPEQIDPRLILVEKNADVRREILRQVGIERVCEALKAECIDRQGDYELLLLDLQDGRRRPYLKMRNPSIGVYHIEGVAPHCRTVAEALKWRNQTDIPPTTLT